MQASLTAADWRRIEPLADIGLDDALIAEIATPTDRPFAAALPGFAAYDSEGLQGCGRSSFPAFSITGPACGLGCAHCGGRILAPMEPATDPAMLEAKVAAHMASGHMRGFLLSGGSNRRNEMPWARMLPAVRRIADRYPHLSIACHTALLDDARPLADAGIGTAMMDVIGDADTIRQVYRLDRPVADFEATLAALCASGMRVVPHIVAGLHYGELRGEDAALEIVARHAVDALVIVVLMPHLAEPGRFRVPDAAAVARLIARARRTLPHIPVLLGCARPHGAWRRRLDAYAVYAGVDGVALPAGGAVDLARALGRRITVPAACCAVGCG